MKLTESIIARGYAVAKTPEQIKKVQAYEKELKERLARMNKMLDEILKS